MILCPPINSGFVADLKEIQLKKDGVDFVRETNYSGQHVFRTTPERIEDDPDSPWNVTETNPALTQLH